MAEHIAAGMSLSDIAWQVYRLVDSPGARARFAEMVDAHLAPFGEWGVAGVAQLKAEGSALIEASKQRRFTGNKPPTQKHVFRLLRKTVRGKLVTSGAWVLPVPEIPKPRPDKNGLQYQYAALAALHDSICTQGNEAERADPIWTEPRTWSANADAFKTFEWRALKKAVSQPNSRAAMTAQLNRALSRVEADLDALGPPANRQRARSRPRHSALTLEVGKSGLKGAPEVATKRVSLRHAAENWFDCADETLTNMILRGSVRATRMADRLWVFDCAEVDAEDNCESPSDYEPSSARDKRGPRPKTEKGKAGEKGRKRATPG
jgi:hypothetical protein